MSIRNKLINLKNHNSWVKLLWFYSLKLRRNKAKKISDIECIRDGYHAGFGKYPDLENPQTFYENVNWLKLHYRNPLMPIVADKYEVRKYLQDLGYGYLLNDMLGVWDNVKDIDINSLPEKFVIKATHASGNAWSRVIKDKSKVDWFAFKQVMKMWLKLKIDWLGREWHYAEMTPRVIAEKYLEDEHGELRDYKIHCFNGKAYMMDVCIGRFTKNKRWYSFDRNGKDLRITFDSIKYSDGDRIKLPENFNEMIELAEELAKPFPCVRVDFYNVDGKIIFGEFTFFDSSGFSSIYTDEGLKLIGSWMNLPQANN